MKDTNASLIPVPRMGSNAVSYERVIEAVNEVVDLLETMDCGWNDTLEYISQTLKDAGFPHRSIDDQTAEEWAAHVARMEESDRQHREAWLHQYRQRAKSKGASDEEVNEILEKTQSLRIAGSYGEEARVSTEFWKMLETRTMGNSTKP